MWHVPQHELIACAAILLAAVILGFAPPYVRRAFFIIVFATGLLAWVANVADGFAGVAVFRLFG